VTKIYISSTYADLREHREAVYRLLRKTPNRDVHAMEDYVASDARPLARCLADVAACDIYVGIFAWRYGYVPPAHENPEALSITQLEYLAAGAAGKQRLIFLLDQEAPWSPVHMDASTGDNEQGKKVVALRRLLAGAHLASFFKSPDQLAGLVHAAVTNWEQSRAPQPAQPPAPPKPAAHVRELRNSLLLAFTPAGERAAKQLAVRLQPWFDKPVLLSKTALFAEDEAQFYALEESAARCSAALITLTPACVDQLLPRAAHVAKALGLLSARTGSLGALLADTRRAALPASWSVDTVIETGADLTLEPGLARLRQWAERALPAWGARLVGLPVSVVAMTAAEVRALDEDPGMIGERLGAAARDRFLEIRRELAAAKLDWTRRYAATREAWQPFGPGGAPAAAIVADIVAGLNQRALPKLRHRGIRAQWYPFEAIVECESRKDTRLRNVYRDVARAGAVLLIDELSLFHPDLTQALTNSPFCNNEQVAIVTISPFNPASSPVNQVLESEARRRLAGALERYATDFDPQCELAVGEERRLRRWLHSSLPETVVSLREPRPDRDAMRAFYAEELGAAALRTPSEYPWAGGSES
jgi:hypothetical protein